MGGLNYTSYVLHVGHSVRNTVDEFSRTYVLGEENRKINKYMIKLDNFIESYVLHRK